MARLVSMWQGYHVNALGNRQMPLVVEENLAMVMDINGLGVINETPLVKGAELEEFTKKMNVLSKEELKNAFEVTYKQMQSILNQSVPCIGCRRSVERLFYDLSNLNGHPSLDPIIVTSDAELTVRDEILASPRRLCTLLHNHSKKLSDLLEHQTRNKKSRRCILHSLEMQRMRPPPNAWKEVWDCMEQECLKEITFIDAETLEVTLDTYLHKHKFCSDCRTKVLLASSLLTTETDPTKEKGYKSALYADIKRCTGGHVHLPLNTSYISSLIGRAQPELMGRERHAKTLEIAQEEVLTCLGICVAERLNLIYRRLREEEIIVKILAAVAIEALSRHFHLAVYIKDGITQLEIYFNEELIKLERRLKLRLKRKEKKERRSEKKRKEIEAMEQIQDQNKINTKVETETEIETISSNVNLPEEEHTNSVDNLQDPDFKDEDLEESCTCSELSKPEKKTEKSRNLSPPQSLKSNKKVTKSRKKKKNEENNKSDNRNRKSPSKREQNGKNKSSNKSVDDESVKPEEFCDIDICNENIDCNNKLEFKEPPPMIEIVEDDPNDREMWIEVKKRLDNKSHNRNSRSSSETSRDCGYSSEHNVSSTSLPCTPEGSEVACSDGCCNHEGDCPETKSAEKQPLSDSGTSVLRDHGGGLSLIQMLENFPDEEENSCYIPAEEVLEFKSKMCQVAEKRQELRQTLKKRFDMLCSHHKPITNIR